MTASEPPQTGSGAKAPPLSLWLREFQHVPRIWAAPIRRVTTERDPDADGRPVLVLPGIMSGDHATSLLRRSIDAAGYRAHGSNFRLVTGITPETLAKAQRRLVEICEAENRKVTLVGHSLGGIYARVLAQRNPDLVSMVLTLGTPFSGNRRANNAWRLYEAINDHKVDAPSLPDDPSLKPPVHTIAMWSPFDGVIAPPCARGTSDERDIAIEVPFEHFAMATHRGSIAKIIEILNQHRAYAS
ncbi:MAG: alpha/beta hydrolase [Erythrobacter sp.]|jgi:pimeloyl-ACP methyl ester carboxylesterase|nr:alpha/beta hydrolase [Erythrobacter sp.]